MEENVSNSDGLSSFLDGSALLNLNSFSSLPEGSSDGSAQGSASLSTSLWESLGLTGSTESRVLDALDQTSAEYGSSEFTWLMGAGVPEIQDLIWNILGFILIFV